MPKSVSLKGIAAGVVVLFAAYVATSWLFGETFPLAPLWAKLSIGVLWHCLVMLFGVQLAAGYVAGRVAGHDHALNGALAASSFSLYLAVLFIADENYRFDLGLIASLVVNPFIGYWGGQLSAGINPLSPPRSAAEAAQLAERRRQKKVQARAGYRLVVLNDEHTPMPFIVEILKRFFATEHAAAVATMLHIRAHGRGVAAIYDHPDAAQAKLAELTSFIAKAGHKLRCTVEGPES